MTVSGSRDITTAFIGRKEALDIFYQRFVYRHTKNIVYLYGGGGVGKTWILRKIYEDNQGDPQRTVPPIIDFFDTQNQSLLGLQTTMRRALEAGGQLDAFASYDHALAQLNQARAAAREQYPGLLASLESKVNDAFIESCRNAIFGHEVVLLFDTFERVQQRYVGKWLLRDFLPKVTKPIVVITGRPVPTPAEVPDNAVSYPLAGLELSDIELYMQRRFGNTIPTTTIERIRNLTNGNPLLIDLISDLLSNRMIRNLDELNQLSRFESEALLKKDIARHFGDPSNLNRIIWAMAFLRRRFDLAILRFIAQHEEFLSLTPAAFDQVIGELEQFSFVKVFRSSENHLLHDEMQQIITGYVLEGADDRLDLRRWLLRVVVGEYYDQLIQQQPELEHQLISERFGYELDWIAVCRGRNTFPELLVQARDHYLEVRRQVDANHVYDLEELLWGELREKLDLFEDDGYDIASGRGQWLRQHSLFDRAEEHYSEMLVRYASHAISIRQALGFVSLRLGKIDQALTILRLGREAIDNADVTNVAAFENLLGQANRAAGYWDKALRHYAQAMRAFTLARDEVGMAGVYNNRGYLYGMEGLYPEAIRECQRALDLLDRLPNPSNDAQTRRMHALLNKGTAYRHAADFDEAERLYRECLRIAQAQGSSENICNAYQQLGITATLRGRRLRETRNDLMGDLALQQESWFSLVRAIEISQTANWRQALAATLHRIARTYEEIYRLSLVASDHPGYSPVFANALTALRELTDQLQLGADEEFPRNLVAHKPFAELGGLEKVARLFELSANIADEVNDFHRSIEALMSLARRLLELERYQSFPIVIRRAERIKGYNYQSELFTAAIEITRASFDFVQERFDQARDRYADGYIALAKQIGYAQYQLLDRLRNLSQNLRKLPFSEQLTWCDYLEQRWLDAGVATTHPEMLRFLEDIRIEAFAQAG